MNLFVSNSSVNFSDELNVSMKVIIKPSEIVTLMAYYSPIRKGRTCCEIQLTIVDNPFEYFTVILRS